MTYNTAARRELVAFFEQNSDRAFTLGEVCAAILNDGKGKSTLYRNVSRLVDSGLVRRLSDGKTRHVTYQFVGGESSSEHLHLKCRNCGKLIHLDAEISHALGDALKKSRGFILDSGALIQGRCGDCAEGCL